MPKHPVNSEHGDHMSDPQPANERFQLSRRHFLEAGAGLLTSGWPLNWWGPIEWPDAAEQSASDEARTSSGQLGDPWWLSYGERARVVHVQSARVVDGDVPHAQTLDYLLGEGIELVSRTASPKAGWQALLGDATHIACVFNHRRYDDVVTEDAVGRILIQQLTDAGYAPNSITLVNGPRYLPSSLGCRTATFGWSDGVQMGEDLEQLASWLFEADAIINLPTLAADPIDGFTGGIGNLARSVIRHPGRYYRAEPATLLPRVLAHLGLSSRLKLTVFNALTVITDPEGESFRDRTYNDGSLILGQDPVATDTVAYDVLSRMRNHLSLPDLPGSHILAAAQRLGLGRYQVHEVDDIFEEVR